MSLDRPGADISKIIRVRFCVATNHIKTLPLARGPVALPKVANDNSMEWPLILFPEGWRTAMQYVARLIQ